jgi:hypothetical protein
VVSEKTGFSRLSLIFTLKLFSSDKFGFASNIWACLSANILATHNVVIGIINDNEPRKL